MNEDRFSDPQLNSIEEQLAAYSPRVSSGEKDRILYACAFEAGQKSASRSLRYWKSGVASLSILLMVAVIPHLSPPFGIEKQALKDSVTSEPISPSRAFPAKPAPNLSKPLVADLDAWQIQVSSRGTLKEQLAKFSEYDPHLRSLSVSSLTRNLSSP